MTPFLKKVCEAACARFGCPMYDLIGPCRESHCVAARRWCWRIARWRDPVAYSLPALGRYFNRDHSTISVALRNPLPPYAGCIKGKLRPRKWPDGLMALCESAGYSLREKDIAARIGCRPSAVFDARKALRAAGRIDLADCRPWGYANAARLGTNRPQRPSA